MNSIQQLVVITEENLRAIDDLLAYLEDSIHGKDGEAITRARKYIVEYKPLEPIVSNAFDAGADSLTSILIEGKYEIEKYIAVKQEYLTKNF